MHRLPLSPGDISGTHFCYKLSRPQGHGAAGMIRSMKNSSDPQRESNPRPSGLERSASSNCATADPQQFCHDKNRIAAYSQDTKLTAGLSSDLLTYVTNTESCTGTIFSGRRRPVADMFQPQQRRLRDTKCNTNGFCKSRSHTRSTDTSQRKCHTCSCGTTAMQKHARYRTRK